MVCAFALVLALAVVAFAWARTFCLIHSRLAEDEDVPVLRRRLM